jgi:peptidoglycan/xylan/chitin deacetylase (PgdA/CDA1 family)
VDTDAPVVVQEPDGKGEDVPKIPNPVVTLEALREKYGKAVVKQWGETVAGVVTRIDTEEKVIALTFDACGGGAGMGYDRKLVEYLIREKVPATLFLNGRWIEGNRNLFEELAANPLFEIENHGTLHKPLSVEGRSVYGIRGTSGVDAVVKEIMENAKTIEEATGRKPKYFRSGTAYYDDVAVRIALEMGVTPVNFDVIADGGATFSENGIVAASLRAKPGSILIYHMNHPEKSVAEGVMKAIPLLREKGFRFVLLEEFGDRLR